MIKKIFLLLLLTMSLVLIPACGSQNGDGADTNQNNQGSEQNADDLQLDEELSADLTVFQTKDINGNEVTQDIFADYPLTLVNVWGTFCGPCIQEMPHLGELQKEYETKGCNIVGLVIDAQNEDLQVLDDQIELARDIVLETGADYTHFLISKEMIQPVLSQFDAIPASFFVDSNGNIVSEFYIGSRSKEDWSNIIEENIAKQK